MRQFIKGQMITEQMKIRASLKGENKALRIQAYERLTLFCERINVMNLIMRLDNAEMDNTSLKNALLISIQKEFEHNQTQQIYISSQLWDMVTLLKDNAIAAITRVYLDYESKDKDNFKEQLMKQGLGLERTMARKVREAIRKEVELFFQ